MVLDGVDDCSWVFLQKWMDMDIHDNISFQMYEQLDLVLTAQQWQRLNINLSFSSTKDISCLTYIIEVWGVSS